MRSLPCLARAGYPAHEAIKLPSWLFWAIVEADAKDRTQMNMELHKAVGVGTGSFLERSREQIIDSWNAQLTTPIRGVAVDRQMQLREMDWEERAAMWGGG